MYDLAGCAWEFVATYLNGTNNTNGTNLIQGASKYKDVYDAGTTTDYGKINGVRAYGDSLYEVSPYTSVSALENGKNSVNVGWFSNYSNYMYPSSPYIVFGSHYMNNRGIGLFAFYNNSCVGATSLSFRVTLWNN